MIMMMMIIMMMLPMAKSVISLCMHTITRLGQGGGEGGAGVETCGGVLLG